MPTMKQVQRKARKKIRAITNNTKTRYGVVVSNEQNGGAQNPFVSVRDDQSGQLLPSVTNAFSDLSQGTKVELLGRGRAGSEAWSIVRPVRYTKGQRGGNANAIINTPSFARVATGLHAIVNGTPYFFLRIAIWQIREQYRDGQRVKYEVQLQKSVGADLPLTLTVGEHRQMGAALRTALGNGDNGSMSLEELTVSVPETPRPEYHFDPYGAVDVQGEIIYHNGEGADTLVSLSRGEDTPEGAPTSDVDHDAGEFVLARTVMVETINLAANTAYRYRVRAIIGDKTSNYSDWETATTAYDTTVPGWSVTPTPTIANIAERLVANWTAVNVNVAHFMDYEVQYGSDITFATNTKTDYTRSTQYSFSYPISAQGYLRVRPRNTSFQVGSWSNTARFANGRDIARGRPLANLLTNGTFDSGYTSWANTGDGALNHDSTRGFVGLGSLQIEITRTGLGGQAIVEQTVTGLSEGDELALVGYAAKWATFDETLDELYLQIASGSAHLESPVAELTGLATVDTGQWTPLEVPSFIVPYGQTSVKVRLVVEWSGTPSETTFAYFDDIALYKVARHTKGVQTGAYGNFDALRLGNHPLTVLTGSTTWNPPSIAVGASTSQAVTVIGVALGDVAFVTAGHTALSFSDVKIEARITGANTVTVTLTNLNTLSARDVGSGTVTAAVLKVG